MLSVMVDDSWQRRTTELLWPDPLAGPLHVRIGWEILGERWEIVALTIARSEGAARRPLSTSDLRALRLPAVRAEGAKLLEKELAAEALALRTKAPHEVGSRRAHRAALLRARRAEEALAARPPRRRGRPAMARPQLERIANVYLHAFNEHRPPTKAVAAYLGCSRTAAAKRIARCRAQGILGPTERGKAAVGIFVRRGSAHTLQEQILADALAGERRAQMAGGEGRPKETPCQSGGEQDD